MIEFVYDSKKKEMIEKGKDEIRPYWTPGESPDYIMEGLAQDILKEYFKSHPSKEEYPVSPTAIVGLATKKANSLAPIYNFNEWNNAIKKIKKEIKNEMRLN